MPVPIGLSAPPFLTLPNSGSILPVLNRCLVLTKNEVMLKTTGMCSSEEWVGDKPVEGAKVWVLEPMLPDLGLGLLIWS